LGTRFYGSDDPTNGVSALKKEEEKETTVAEYNGLPITTYGQPL